MLLAQPRGEAVGVKDMFAVSNLYLLSGLNGTKANHAFLFPTFFILFDQLVFLFVGGQSLGKDHGHGEGGEVEFYVCRSEFGGVVGVEQPEPQHHLIVNYSVGLPYLFDDDYDSDDYADQ